MVDLRVRSEEEEIMDDLTCSGEVVDQTLHELDVINQLLGGNQISTRAFKTLVRGRNDIHFVDLGCGSGAIMRDLAKWCRDNGIKAKFTGVDANPAITTYAYQHSTDFPEIEYVSINVLDDEFLNQKFDIIHSCLFTHHFSSEELITLFKAFKRNATLGVIINDLHRHFLAYYSIRFLTSIFSKSSMVKNDASVSVARGFRKKELLDILEKSGIKNYKIIWKWAFRWKLVF